MYVAFIRFVVLIHVNIYVHKNGFCSHMPQLAAYSTAILEKIAKAKNICGNFYHTIK